MAPCLTLFSDPSVRITFSCQRLKQAKHVLVFASICPSHTEKEGGQSGWVQLLNNFHQESRLLLSYSNFSLWLCHLDCKMAAGLPDITSKFQAGRRGKGQQKAFQEVPLAEFRDWDMWLH